MLTLEFERLGVARGDIVLDIGCGNGRHAFEALKRGAHVVAADLKTEVLQHVAEWVEAMRGQSEIPDGTAFVPVQANALDLPFADGAFDHVIASEVLEHIPDDDRAIQEIARVMKHGATAGVTVPRFWPEKVCWALSDEYSNSAGGHVRIYRAPELRQKLEGNGLEPLATRHAHSLHAPYWWLKCMFGVENDRALAPSLYHRFLVWQITKRPPLIDSLEHTLDPVLGKSVVFYARKNGRPS